MRVRRGRNRSGGTALSSARALPEVMRRRALETAGECLDTASVQHISLRHVSLALLVCVCFFWVFTMTTTSNRDSNVSWESNRTTSCAAWASLQLALPSQHMDVQAPHALVLNNVWGVRESNVGQQCIFCDRTAGSCGWHWRWSNALHRVLAFPAFVFGFRPMAEASTTPMLPAKVGDLTGVRFSSASLVSRSSSGSSALTIDMWLGQSARPAAFAAGSVSHEIVLWLSVDGLRPGAQRVFASFGEYDVFVNTSFLAHQIAIWFVPHAGLRQWTGEALDVDLHAILTFCVGQGLLSTDVFLQSIEFGVEIIAGEGLVEASGVNFEVTTHGPR